ncbi:MAG: protease inhibitor I42 family protein [Nitrospira sp.]|nr:protease inhibitor I42 family protein [Nitrospira sp.]
MNSIGQNMPGPSEGQEKRAIEAVIGRAFTIHLWEDRTRGEQWVPSYNTTALTLVDDRFLRVASNNAVENGQRIFEFQGVLPGTHELLFEKRMGWKFTSEDRRIFLIQVSPAGKG